MSSLEQGEGEGEREAYAICCLQQGLFAFLGIREWRATLNRRQKLFRHLPVCYRSAYANAV
jgi:hypothetical protein